MVNKADYSTGIKLIKKVTVIHEHRNAVYISHRSEKLAILGIDSENCRKRNNMK